MHVSRKRFLPCWKFYPWGVPRHWELPSCAKRWVLTRPRSYWRWETPKNVGMLKMAAIGVAMGNGSGLAKDAADDVLEESNDKGAAGLAMEVLGGV